MARLGKTSMAALSTAALVLVVSAGCQMQGEAPAPEAEAAEAMTPEAEAAEAMSAAAISELLVGNTILGINEEAGFRWAEYFSSDGTAKALLKMADQPDLQVAGEYRLNDQSQLCKEYPEFGESCFTLYPLGDGRYQQHKPDGAESGIYTQILEGEQLDALE